MNFSHLEVDPIRERLRSGTLLDAWRADPPPGTSFRSEEELAASLRHVLRTHDPAQDLHVFGYGSLMWNPALEYSQVQKARLQGWHRRFCLRLFFGRGSPREPGIMMALDRGGSCHGMLFRIPASKLGAELHLLWRREMVAGSYDARWVTTVAEGRRVRALTFVVNRRVERYIGGAASVEETARLIRTGRGQIGTSRAYFEESLRALDRLGVKDAGMERLRLAVARADEAIACP